MKAVYSIFKRLIENEHILEDNDQEGNLIEMMIKKNNIEEILGEDSDLEVNEIK